MHDFLEKLSSPTPTPGGGSVSAMSAAMAAGLLSMVSGLTINKKSSQSENINAPHPLSTIPSVAQKIMKRCEELVIEDAQAYDKVVSAYKMPKETDSDKEKRKQEIQESLKYAAEVPLETAHHAFKLLEIFSLVAEHGLKSASSDIEVAFFMAKTALHGALLNVKANTSSITDDMYRRKLEEECALIESKVFLLFEKTYVPLN